MRVFKNLFSPITSDFSLCVPDQFVHRIIVYLSFERFPPLHVSFGKTIDRSGSNFEERAVSSALYTSVSSYEFRKTGNLLFHSSTVLGSTWALSPDKTRNDKSWRVFNFSSHPFDALNIVNCQRLRVEQFNKIKCSINPASLWNDLLWRKSNFFGYFSCLFLDQRSWQRNIFALCATNHRKTVSSIFWPDSSCSFRLTPLFAFVWKSDLYSSFR